MSRRAWPSHRVGPIPLTFETGGPSTIFGHDVVSLLYQGSAIVAKKGHARFGQMLHF